MYVHLKKHNFPLQWQQGHLRKDRDNAPPPGRIALCTDADCFQNSTGSQLLHHPPRVVPDGATRTTQVSRCAKTDGLSTGSSIHHSLKRELLVIGFDAADVVRRGSVQRLHQQRERAGELQRWRQKQVEVQRRRSRNRSRTKPTSAPCLPRRPSAVYWPASFRAWPAWLWHLGHSQSLDRPPLGKSWPGGETVKQTREAGTLRNCVEIQHKVSIMRQRKRPCWLWWPQLAPHTGCLCSFPETLCTGIPPVDTETYSNQWTIWVEQSNNDFFSPYNTFINI